MHWPRSVSGSLAVSSCPAPAPAAREQLAPAPIKEQLAVMAEEEAETLGDNPTPQVSCGPTLDILT